MPLMLGVVDVDGKNTSPYWITQTQYTGASTTSNGTAFGYDVGLNSYMATKNGTNNITVIKQGLRADVIWEKTITTGIGLIAVNSIAIDSSQNVYVSAHNNNTGYIYKLDSNGAIVWARSVTTTGSGLTNPQIKLDSGNNIIFVTNQSTSTTQQGIEIIKINSNTGAIVWQQRYAHSNTSFYMQYTNQFNLDSSDNIYLTAFWQDGSNVVTNGVVKFNSSGVPQWHTQIGGTVTGLTAFGRGSVAVASDGSVYYVGATSVSTSTTIRFVKLNSSGILVWNTSILTSPSSNLENLCAHTDSSGNFYAGFYYINDTTGNKRWFLTKWNIASATLIWQNYIDNGRNANSNVIWGQGVLNNTKSFLGVGFNYTNPQANYSSAYIKVPLNGTKTGTYTLDSVGWIYGASSLTLTAETLTTGNILQTYTTGNALVNTITNPTISNSTVNIYSLALP